MMDILAGLVDGLDPASVLPDLEMLFSKLAGVARVAVLVGPAALLLLGLLYLFLAPKEANHYIGFRCWWGMGSVEAWQFTQKLAGGVWTAMGLVLGIIALVSGSGYAEMPQDEMLFGALETILLQIVGVIVSILLINVVLIVLFDHKGVRRVWEKPAREVPAEEIPAEEIPEEEIPAEEVPEEELPEEEISEEEAV